MLKKSGILLCCLLFTQAVLAEDADYSHIYHKQCATCHGNEGDGKGRAGATLSPVPTDFTSQQSKTSLTAEKIIAAIRNGSPGTAMAAYGRRFNEAQIRGLAEYIRKEFMGDKTLVAETAQADVLGKKIYADNCSACHGDNGNTAVWAKNGLNPPPRNFTADRARKELSRGRMIASITHGRPGTAMMPFASRLSKSEIEAVVDYIREDFMKISTARQKMTSQKTPAVEQIAEHADVNMQAEFSQGLTGNYEAGKTFYQSNCFTCHGKKGLGDGPRAHFNVPRPRNFTSEASQSVFNRPRLFTAISQGKRGTVMPAWSAVLSDQQIADVAEYVFQAFIQETKKKL